MSKSFPPEKWKTNFHPLSPTYFLPHAATVCPEALAVVHQDRHGNLVRRTYQEFADRAMGLAYYINNKGYSHVGILAPNTPGFLDAVYGIGAAGAVNVAINYRLQQMDITYIFTHADVDAIIVDQEYLSLLDDFRRNRPNVDIIIDYDDASVPSPLDQAIQDGLGLNLASGSQHWDGLKVHPENENSLIALAYTSGTTARPKGVEYIHRGTYLASVAAVTEYGFATVQSTGGCRYLWTLPMFHAMGWCCVWAITMARGTHYTLRKIDYPMIWKLLKDEGITHFCAAPTVNTLLCNSPEASALPEPVNVIVAASPPTPHLFEQMSGLNLHPMHVYGMTETYGPLTKCYPSPEWDHIPLHQKYHYMARQGHAFSASLGARVIRRPDAAMEDTDKVVEVAKDGKEIGEVCFMGNLCANAYYKDEEATRKLFEGGMLHSGDLAVWHTDGSIQVLDRSKDIIISGGENISSVALESVLATHPDILEVGVVAVPDKHWGECPKAYITVKHGAQLNGKDVIEWARQAEGISRFMVPREVEIIDDLPKTSTGKIQKHVLRKWAQKGMFHSKL